DQDRPPGIDLERHADLRGRGQHSWWRRAILVVIAAIPVLGLFNVFGQRTQSSRAVSPQASLLVKSPSHLRGGLMFTSEIVVTGDLIQNGVTQSDQSVTGVILVLCTIGILQVVTSFLGFRFRPLRRFLQGEPIVLVREG